MMLRWAAVTLPVVLALSCAPRYQAHVERAKEAAVEGDMLTASREAESAIALIENTKDAASGEGLELRANLAALYMQAGRTSDAMRQYDVLWELSAPSDTKAWGVALGIAEASASAGDLSVATRWYDRLLERVRLGVSANDPNLLLLECQIIQFRLSSGGAVEARNLTQQLIQGSGSFPAAKLSTDVLVGMFTTAEALVERGEYGWGERLMATSILLASNSEINIAHQREMQSSLALLHARMGDHEGAAAILRNLLLAQQAEADDAAEVAVIHSMLASVLAGGGDATAAANELVNLIGTLGVNRANPAYCLAFTNAVNTGTIVQRMYAYAPAARIFETLYDLVGTPWDVTCPGMISQVRVRLAVTRQLTGRRAEAIGLLHEEVAALRVRGANPVELRPALTNLATMAVSADLREELLLEALSLEAGELEPASRLSLRAELSELRGDRRQAEAGYREAARLAPPDSLEATASEARADDVSPSGPWSPYNERLTTAKAFALAREAAYGPVHPITAGAIFNIGRLEFENGHYEAACDTFLRASNLQEEFLGQTAPSLAFSEQIAMSRAGTRAMLEHSISACPPIRAKQTYSAVMASKGRLAESMRRRAVLSRLGTNSALAVLTTELRVIQADLARQLQTGVYEDLPALRAKKERLEHELYADPVYRDAEDALPQGAISLLAETLVAGSVFIDIYRIDRAVPGGQAPANHYMAFVVTSDGSVSLTDLGDASKLDKQIRDWRIRAQNFETPGIRPDSQFLEDFATLLRTVLPPDTTHVTLSADGALWRLPWQLLPLGGLSLGVVPSPRDYVRFAGARGETEGTDSGQFLMLGDVDYNVGSAPHTLHTVGPLDDLRTEENEELQALDGLMALAREAGIEPLRLSGVEATEEALSRSISGSSYVHFATHGVVDLTPDAQGLVVEPLLSSALALSGFNAGWRADQRGVLSAEDILSMDLRGVRVVTLAGCNTGSGANLDGEGVLGFTSSFLAAGAGGVVVSLWPVPVESTRVLVREFYAQVLRGAPPAWALREAQIAVSQTTEYRHSIHWAGWSYIGVDH